MGTRTRVARVAAFIAFSATLLSGCAALGILDDRGLPEPSPTATTLETSPPEPAPVQYVDVPDGAIAARGTFSGTVSGRIEIVREGGWWRLDLIDLALPADRQFSLYLLGRVPTSTGCAGQNWGYGSVSPLPSGSSRSELPPDDFFADPTFFAGAMISGSVDRATCSGRAIDAWAPFEWTIPDLRPDGVPGDRGPGPGATGEIIDGHYWVAAGDTYGATADRFGVTVEGLDYLNVLRPYGAVPETLEAGCTLNVIKTDRGFAEWCPWYE